MKRKLLHGLLLATAFVGVGIMQSCKDYESDLQNEWKQQNYTLEEEIALLKNRVGDLQAIQAECQKKCDEKIKKILDIIGVWDPATQGTLADAITKLLNQTPVTPPTPGDPGLTAEQVKTLIYNTLIEKGWPANPDGTPRYVDLNALEQTVLDLAEEVAMMQGNIAVIQGYINYLEGLDLEARLAAIEAWIASHGQHMTPQEVEDMIRTQLDIYKLEVNNALSVLRSYIDQQDQLLAGRIDEMLTTINSLGSRLTVAETNALNALNLANTNKQNLESLGVLVEGLQTALDAANDRIDELETQVGINSSDIAELKTKYANLLNRIENLESQYEELDGKFTELSNKYQTLNDQVSENTTAIAGLLEAIKGLATKEALSDLEQRVAANEEAIQALQEDVNTLFGLYNRLNKLVTGIIVQGCYNSLFGSFALPIGVQSNMLLNYYGEYQGVKDLVFPSQSPSTEQPMLTAEEVANLGSLIDPITIKSGEFLMDGNMGKVYLTINPNNIALDGVSLSMESSNGTPCRVELQNVRSSWENLTFGYSRAGNNGFYEADAVLPLTAGAVHDTQFKLVDGLKSAMKALLSDRSKANVFSLLKAVYQEINQDLPAYAVKTSWTADDGKGEKEYAVFSNYNIAAVTFRPLSYNTYRGQSINHQFKHHGPLKDVMYYLNKMINNKKFHFSLNMSINVKPVSATFHLKEITDLKFDYNGQIIAVSEGLDIYDDAGNVIGHTGRIEIPVQSDDLDDFLASIAQQIMNQFNGENGYLAQWDKQMEDEFNRAMTEMIDQVNDEVNKAMAQLEADINGQIDKILNDLKNDIANKTQGLMDKLNKFLDKYNDAIDKINDFMADPNHYLQVAMIYTTGGGNLHRLSNDVNDPTILNPAGGNAVELIATSYTAEIAAPAYKKFVAVSAGWDANGKPLSASEIQAVNQNGELAKVLTGRAKRIGLPTSRMKSGYKYQIVYIGLDYHGYTSTERYYVKMK